MTVSQLKRPIIIFATLFTIAVGIYWFTSLSSPPPSKPQPMSVAEKKAHFKKLVVPAVNAVYAKLEKRYNNTKAEISKNPESTKLKKLREEYRAEDNNELLAALKPHPRSIAIAQAALESSWATSRFSREANNLFGVWSFDENEPRIAAGQQRGDKTVWVKKYSSVRASVEDYYRILARGEAFKEFRALRAKTDDPLALVTRLDRYSEKGEEYGDELVAIINFNHFTEYDKK